MAQTLSNPAIRNSVMPGETATPSRTPSSATTPLAGEIKVYRACAIPVASLWRTSSGGIDKARVRVRAAVTRSSGAPARFNARSSFCGPSQSGAKTVANAWPLRTRSIGARTERLST